MNWHLWKLLPLVVLSLSASAQNSQAPSPSQNIDASGLVRLTGSLHPLAQARYDRGAVSDSLPVQRVLILLKPSADREAALQRFLTEAHSPDSPNYHRWLTPDQYGAQFGASDEDTQAVVQWLQSSGFAVARVTRSKTMIEFSGTAAAVRSGLHTEIHEYQVDGTSFYANDREISVPAAIAPRIRAVAPLNSRPLTSYLRVMGKGELSRATRRVTPKFTTTSDNAPFYALAPEDLATQYDLAPVYSAGTNGAGQTIGIIGTANLNIAVVDSYRKLFGLGGDLTQVIVDGEDPGDGISPDVEGYLDVEASGAVAPAANINFYVAGGQPFQNSLALAALRAIDDNQAAVLSVSYGECEQLLGEAGNQLWAGLWQQAAAQGQTVLVASGDSGPAACPLGVGTNGSIDSIVYFGAAVSGLTSTPWNVSVGGTDFYYSDYASGGASIPSLWNNSNDGKLGSLKATLPEQPWDDALGLNVVPFFSVNGGFSIPSAAGAGGVSSCSQETPSGLDVIPSCIAGYAKPIWQQGPGVPNDGARDLPDVSLFAASGQNLSAWPICAEPGDCTPGASSIVTLVGGTSASTPAMAGILALINQKYGRQGQADFTLYALARQQPGVFHDITLGTNDVLCESQAPGCIQPVVNPSAFELNSFGIYAAGPGYDLASGLGSVDVNLLLNNWTKVVTSPTTTSLKISPTTVVHGSPVAVTSSVQAVSGAGVPTGSVALDVTPASSLRGNGLLPLTAGAAAANVATLPGGTYQVTAQYEGDGVFGASTSSPVTLTVTPEPSVTALSIAYEAPSPILGVIQTGTVANGGQVLFGSLVTYQATPSGPSSQSSGLATGTATFTDGAIASTVPLNVNGVATWPLQTLALGPHSVTVSYSGDASYAASTAGPATFTVVKGTPTLSTQLLEQPPILNCPPTIGFCNGEYLAGTSLAVHVLLDASNANVPPTGTVTVTLGGLTQTATIVANSYVNGNLATAFVVIPSVPAGTYTLNASYSGDNNWNATTAAPQSLAFAASSAVATTTTTLTASPSAVGSSDSVTFKITVQANSSQYSSGAPIGEVLLLANGSVFASGIDVASGIVANSMTASATLTVPATEIPVGAQQVVATYTGSPGFAPSTSAPVSLTVSDTDFTLSSSAASIALKSGQAGSVGLLLGSGYGLSVPVTLTCLPSTSAFSCSINPTSMSVSGSSTASLLLNAFIPGAAAAQSVVPPSVPPAPDKRIFAAGLGLACLFAIWLPAGRRRFKMHLGCLLLLAMGCGMVGCGGRGASSGSSGPSGPSGPQPPANVNTPAGSYSVVVQGVSGGVTHNVRLTVLVQ